ncbi:MAG: TIGR00296 family protein [Candidatus Njordarchaeales archaeon]
MEELADSDGVYLVRLARRAIEEYVLNKKRIAPPKDAPSKLYEKAGAFVTINKIIGSREELRGCIGYILPIKPLVETIIDVAIAAAVEDPRFPPLSSEELDEIIVEVTVLTPPQKIEVRDPKEYLEKIVIGRDGLLLKYGPFSGTLLPQVPIEYNWDVEEFLDNLCVKAGLVPGCWKDLNVEIFAYQGAIWKETSPRGEIIRVELSRQKKC